MHEREQQPKYTDEQELRRSLAPKIYVASLSDYNSGTLHGEWISAAQSTDDIHNEIRMMLAKSEESNAEEWAIHDYEDFGAVRLHEYEDMSVVATIASGLVEHGPTFGHWAEHCRVECDRASLLAELTRFEEAYLECWESQEAFAESMLDDCGFEEELD